MFWVLGVLIFAASFSISKMVLWADLKKRLRLPFSGSSLGRSVRKIDLTAVLLLRFVRPVPAELVHQLGGLVIVGWWGDELRPEFPGLFPGDAGCAPSHIFSLDKDVQPEEESSIRAADGYIGRRFVFSLSVLEKPSLRSAGFVGLRAVWWHATAMRDNSEVL